MIGGFHIDADKPTCKKLAELYSVEYGGNDKQLKVRCMDEVDKIWCANSLAFSTDGNTMYFTDSHTLVINTYPYDQKTGKAGKATPFHSTAEYFSKTAPGFNHLPDGSCID